MSARRTYNSVLSASRQVEISDSSQVAEARRVASQVAAAAGLEEVECGRVAIIATELANNVLRHARRGHLIVSALGEASEKGVEMIAFDRGPGMRDVSRCMEDGFSTIGTAGTGLGAVRRLSTEFDIYTLTAPERSGPPHGTAVLSRVWSSAPGNGRFALGAISVALHGESVCGDGWQVTDDEEEGSSFAVIDGLGHGPTAAEAARAAIDVLSSAKTLGVEALITRAHGALRSTRGAAMAVAHLRRSDGVLRYGGVGNISGTIFASGASRSMISHSGTVGMELRKVQEFQYPWSAESLLVMHSDGISAQWHLEAYPGLASRHPSIIAAVLFRDFRRSRDDSTIVVARQERRE